MDDVELQMADEVYLIQVADPPLVVRAELRFKNSLQDS